MPTDDAPLPPPERLPTLTEVIEAGVRVDSPAALPDGADAPGDGGATPAGAVATPLDEARIVSQVMLDLQRRIDLMLEYRLREALAPALARAADQLIQEARAELAETLRDVVARAVAQEVARHRPR